MFGLIATWCLSMAVQAGSESPRAVLDRAIEAVGGEQQLRKLAKSQYKSGVCSYINGQPQPEMQWRWLIRLPDCLRQEIIDHRQAASYVLRGSEGWVQTDGEYGTMRERAVQALRDDLHGLKIQYLLEAREPYYHLQMLPPKRVEGTWSVGILVRGDGVPDVSLYFDKGSGLLVKSEMHVRDMLLGHTLFQEIYFKGYENLQGLKYPMHLVIYQDYSKFREIKVKEVKFLETIRDSEFIRPG